MLRAGAGGGIRMAFAIAKAATARTLAGVQLPTSPATS
jgi:hypothetical protein